MHFAKIIGSLCHIPTEKFPFFAFAVCTFLYWIQIRQTIYECLYNVVTTVFKALPTQSWPYYELLMYWLSQPTNLPIIFNNQTHKKAKGEQVIKVEL